MFLFIFFSFQDFQIIAQQIAAFRMEKEKKKFLCRRRNNNMPDWLAVHDYNQNA